MLRDLPDEFSRRNSRYHRQLPSPLISKGVSCPGLVDTGQFGLEESMMSKARAAYPGEFRRQTVDLGRAGRLPE